MITVCRKTKFLSLGQWRTTRSLAALMAVKIAEKLGAGVSVLMSGQQSSPVYKIAPKYVDGSKYYGWQRQNEVRSVKS